MDERVKDGGPAFPVTHRVGPEPYSPTVTHLGLSLRDWFAGKALAGILAGNGITHDGKTVTDADSIANAAHHFAAAMLRAREKGNDHE